VYFYIGQAYEAMGKIRTAVDYYEKASAEVYQYKGSALKNKLFTSLGRLYLELGKKEEAIGYFRMVLAEFPHNSEALYNLGKIYFDEKNFLKAKEYLEKYLAVNSQNISVYHILAKTYYSLEDYQKALNMLNIYFEKGGSSGSVEEYNENLIFLTDIYFCLKRYSEVISTLKPLMEDNTVLPKVLPRVILSYLKMGDISKAINVGNDYILKVSQNERAPVLYELANAYVSYGEIYRAIEVWKTIRELHPHFKDIDEILLKYEVLIQNPFLENIFTTDESKTLSFVLKKFNIKEFQIFYKSEIFWVIRDENLCYILYKEPVPVILSTLTSIENFLIDEGLSTYSVTLYSLFGVDQSCYSSNFFRKLKLVSGEAFVVFFKSE
jgi:tetratricopeptide (TPR) repeat protein